MDPMDLTLRLSNSGRDPPAIEDEGAAAAVAAVAALQRDIQNLREANASLREQVVEASNAFQILYDDSWNGEYIPKDESAYMQQGPQEIRDLLRRENMFLTNLYDQLMKSIEEADVPGGQDAVGPSSSGVNMKNPYPEAKRIIPTTVDIQDGLTWGRAGSKGKAAARRTGTNSEYYKCDTVPGCPCPALKRVRWRGNRIYEIEYADKYEWKHSHLLPQPPAATTIPPTHICCTNHLRRRLLPEKDQIAT